MSTLVIDHGGVIELPGHTFTAFADMNLSTHFGHPDRAAGGVRVIRESRRELAAAEMAAILDDGPVTAEDDGLP